jgi:hypothetical protein
VGDARGLGHVGRPEGHEDLAGAELNLKDGGNGGGGSGCTSERKRRGDTTDEVRRDAGAGSLSLTIGMYSFGRRRIMSWRVSLSFFRSSRSISR